MWGGVVKEGFSIEKELKLLAYRQALVEGSSRTLSD